MAIKGKRRGRSRTGRTVATAPRPYLVPPKTPLMRRTGTKLVLVLVAEALVFGLLVLGDLQTDADARREELIQFTSLVEAQLYQGGVAQQSFPGPLVLPELGQTIPQIRGGEFREKDVLEKAQSWSDLAVRAGDGIGGVKADLAALKQARHLMQQGLLLYAELADQIRLAVQLEGETQQALLDSIEQQFAVAARIFDTGYNLLQEERRKAGLPIASTPAGGIPPTGPDIFPGGS